jgi:hypothetical protein
MKIRIQTLKSIIFTVFVMLPWALSAQESALVTKIEQALDDGLYKRAIKLCEEAMEDSELRKSAVPYLLGAETYYHIHHDEFLSEKYPDAVSDAIKFLEKAERKDDGPALLKGNPDLLAKIVGLNNEEAIAMYNVTKYYKALRTFKKSYDINGDTTAYFWMGKTSMTMGDTAIGRIYYDTLMQRFDGAFAARGKSKVMVPDPYLFYGEYYWDRQKYDSAAIYLLAGRQIFDNNARLNYYLTEVYKEQIKQMPPSVLLKEKVQEALGYFPLDTTFLHKDNAIHLYLYRNYVENQDSLNARMLLSEFAQEKVDRYASKDKKFLTKWDGFVSEKTSDAIWKVTKYYYTHGHDQASRSAINHYMEITADSTDEESLVKRWIIITEFAAEKESLGLASLILKAGNDRYPSNQDLLDYRRTLVLKFSANNEDISEVLALRTLLIDEYSENSDPTVGSTLKSVSTEILSPLMKKGDYALAAKIAKEESKRAENKKDQDHWSALRKKVAKEDFYYNYYETRMTKDSVLGEWINEFEWNGDKFNCDPGNVKVTIQRKVESRINYFRRNAGVPEIVMVDELNEWCQQAALIMESNDKLDHNPQRNWRCYTPEGAKAAKYGLLTKGANTTIAVTSFFADNQNTALGNRRWLMYPNAKEYGHGSTTNYSCIWALDDSGSTDSATYKDQFIAWPNEGYLPAMMAFDHWSFSMYRDMKGAKVSMTADGNPVKLKQQAYKEGYGMPTLVWTPDIDRKKIDNETKYDVTIRFSDGKTVKYTVNLFPFVAEAY